MALSTHFAVHFAAEGFRFPQGQYEPALQIYLNFASRSALVPFDPRVIDLFLREVANLALRTEPIHTTPSKMIELMKSNNARGHYTLGAYSFQPSCVFLAIDGTSIPILLPHQGTFDFYLLSDADLAPNWNTLDIQSFRDSRNLLHEVPQLAAFTSNFDLVLDLSSARLTSTELAYLNQGIKFIPLQNHCPPLRPIFILPPMRGVYVSWNFSTGTRSTVQHFFSVSLTANRPLIQQSAPVHLWRPTFTHLRLSFLGLCTCTTLATRLLPHAPLNNVLWQIFAHAPT